MAFQANMPSIVASKRPPPMPIGYNDFGIDAQRQVLYRNFHEVPSINPPSLVKPKRSRHSSNLKSSSSSHQVSSQVLLIEISRDPRKIFIIIFPNYEVPKEHQIVVMAEKQAYKLMAED